jgi:hypothetical protein
MRAPEFSDLARNTKADAICELLDGGRLRLYDEGGLELASLRFHSPAFLLARSGEALAHPLDPEGGAAASGRPARFRAFAHNGEFVFGGTAGPPDTDEEYDLEVDGDVQEGGEVMVERLMYEEPAREGAS